MNMNSMMIAPSILSADFSRLGQEIRAVEQAGAEVIHVDVMDGHFVPNITIGPLVVRAVRQVTALPVDVHLMITEPDRYLRDFAEAGADWITVMSRPVPTCTGQFILSGVLGKRPGLYLIRPPLFPPWSISLPMWI